MTTFTYGDFVFQEIDSRTCRIGSRTVLTGKGEDFANGPISGSSYKGQAIIPEIAYNSEIKRKYKVVETSSYCFRSCSLLNTIILPKTLEKIRTDSFYLTKITQLTFPASVKEFEDWALSNAQSLTTLVFEVGSKLKKLGKSVFAGTTLTKIVFPPSLKEIGVELFILNTASSISFIYCGSNVLSTETALTNPSTVSAFATSRYPQNAKIGGLDQQYLNEDECISFYTFERKTICSHNHYCRRNGFLTFLFISLMSSY